MEHQRAVRLDRTKQFAEEHKLTSYSMSARTGESVSVSCSLQSKHFSFSSVTDIFLGYFLYYGTCRSSSWYSVE